MVFARFVKLYKQRTQVERLTTNECIDPSDQYRDITFLPTLSEVVLSLPGLDDSNLQGDLGVTAVVTLHGGGVITITTVVSDRVFNVRSGELSLTSVTVIGGDATYGSPDCW